MSEHSDPGELDAAYEWLADARARFNAMVCACGHTGKSHNNGSLMRHAGDTDPCKECGCLDWTPT